MQFVRRTLLPFVLFWLALGIGWSTWYNSLYGGSDGCLYLTLIEQQFEYSNPGVALSTNPFQGTGSLAIPMPAWINPGYAVLGLIKPGLWQLVASYSIFLAEFYFALLFLAYCTGLAELGWARVTLGIQLACLMVFPPFATQLGMFGQLELNPGVAHTIAIQLTCLACLVTLGTGSWYRNAGLIACMACLAIYSILCDPLWSMVLVAPTGGFVLGLVLLSRSWRELVWRLTALVVVAMVLLGLDIPNYYRGLVGFVARVIYEDQTVFEPQVPWLSSMAFRGGMRILTHFCLLLLGTTYLAVWPGTGQLRTQVRRMAMLGLASMLGLTVVGAIFLYTDLRWTKPLPVYLEQLPLPVFYLLGVVGLLTLLESLCRWMVGSSSLIWRWSVLAQPAVALLLACLLLPGMLARWTTKPHKFNFVNNLQTLKMSRPPVARPIGDLGKALIKELALHPGDNFHGYLAHDIYSGPFAQKLGPGAVALPLDTFDTGLYELYCWTSRIPTITEYSQMISPIYLAFFRTMLGTDLMGSQRNNYFMAIPDARILQAMGVRFAISDKNWNASESRIWYRNKRLVAPDNAPGELFIHELKDPNLGNYSPVQPHLCPTFDSAVARMKSPSFDFRKEVTIDTPLPVDEPLVPVSRSSLQLKRGHWYVTAESEGWSILVLPFQFSHCQHLQGNTASGQAMLFRANLIQTGVLFRGKLDSQLTFEFGPFQGHAERLLDVADVKRLDVKIRTGSEVDPPAYHPFCLVRLREMLRRPPVR